MKKIRFYSVLILMFSLLSTNVFALSAHEEKNISNDFTSESSVKARNNFEIQPRIKIAYNQKTAAVSRLTGDGASLAYYLYNDIPYQNTFSFANRFSECVVWNDTDPQTGNTRIWETCYYIYIVDGVERTYR